MRAKSTRIRSGLLEKRGVIILNGGAKTLQPFHDPSPPAFGELIPHQKHPLLNQKGRIVIRQAVPIDLANAQYRQPKDFLDHGAFQ